MSDRSELLAPPRRRALLGETRALLDFASMTLPLLRTYLRRRGPVGARHVIVVPGFGSDDRYTLPLRHYLNRLGYCAEGWGLGRNMAGVNLPHTLDDLSSRWEVTQPAAYRGEASVPYLCDRLIERVAKRSGTLGEPVAMIGWSLGGYLARETARDLPRAVSQVITLGSPIVGGPKYTAAAPFFRRRGMNLDWIEEEIARREKRPITQPITAIFSKSDGIVTWPATMDRHSNDVRHIEVSASHLGMGFNHRIWSHIVDALQRDETSRTSQQAHPDQSDTEAVKRELQSANSWSRVSTRST